MGSETANAVQGDQGQCGPRERRESREQGRASTRSSKRPSENDLPDGRAKKKPNSTNKTKPMLQSEIEEAKKSINSLNTKCCRLKRDKDILREQNVQLQKTICGLREEHNLPKMDDGDVRNRLQNVMNLCRDWAREYSTERPVDFDALKSFDVTHSIDEALFRETTYSGNLKALGEFTYGNYILLNTFLTHFVCCHIVENPLFFLNRNFMMEPEICPSRQFLSELMGCVPRHKKDAWIGWTLRALEPRPQGNGDDGPLIIYNMILHRTSTFYEKSSKSFIKRATRANLLKALSEGAAANRLRSLVSIMATTGTLILKLRQQNYDIRSLSSTSGLLQGKTFSRESDTMEPHPALRLKPDDTSLDGSEIDFTIQPAIFAYWFDETENEREKLWTKAVVWAGGCEKIGIKKKGAPNCASGSNIKGEPAPTPQTVDNGIDKVSGPMQHSNETNCAGSPQPGFSKLSRSEASASERLLAVENPAVGTSHEAQTKDSAMNPSETLNKSMEQPCGSINDSKKDVNDFHVQGGLAALQSELENWAFKASTPLQQPRDTNEPQPSLSNHDALSPSGPDLQVPPTIARPNSNRYHATQTNHQKDVDVQAAPVEAIEDRQESGHALQSRSVQEDGMSYTLDMPKDGAHSSSNRVIRITYNNAKCGDKDSQSGFAEYNESDDDLGEKSPMPTSNTQRKLKRGNIEDSNDSGSVSDVRRMPESEVIDEFPGSTNSLRNLPAENYSGYLNPPSPTIKEEPPDSPASGYQ
ncbi:hypothetical protein GX51_02979 [Blastomyces parvus]|uniref:Uncharacterized protein n=1 Tax=Blastomyces parvus TaxID=2060905 RepID=A0A2B7X914_9EURO|nr:hypothetical protein GX51_02979 [Blastomyces parvus]